MDAQPPYNRPAFCIYQVTTLPASVDSSDLGRGPRQLHLLLIHPVPAAVLQSQLTDSKQANIRKQKQREESVQMFDA